FLTVAIIALGAAGFTKVQQQEQAVAMARSGPGAERRVAVSLVTRQVLTDRIGFVRTRYSPAPVNLPPKVPHTISRIAFRASPMGEEGEVLVELTSPSEAARLAEAQATADEAQRQYERLQPLLANNLISGTDLDAARPRSDTAQARLEGVIV